MNWLLLLSSIAARGAYVQDDADKSIYPRRTVQWPRVNSTTAGTSIAGGSGTRNGRITPDVRWNCQKVNLGDAWDPITGDQVFDGSDRGTWDNANCFYVHDPAKLHHFLTTFDPADVSVTGGSADTEALIKSHILLLKSSNRLPSTSALAADTTLFTQHAGLKLEVTLGSSVIVPTMYDIVDDPTRESYDLKFDGTNGIVSIQAVTVFGYYNAMSTLSNLFEAYNVAALKQLVAMDKGKEDPTIVNNLHKGVAAELMLPFGAFEVRGDKPSYSHRGIMLDTARSYQPVGVIKRVLDFMHATKLNILHWHATDDQSFPLKLGSIKEASGISIPFTTEVKMQPIGELKETVNATKLVHGAQCDGLPGNTFCHGSYGTDLTYDMTDLAYIQSIAWNYGIRIVYEIDSPSHARSWGSSERAECAMSGFSPTTTWKCSSREDGKDALSTNMCFGVDYQLNDEICVQQLCGPLNFKVDDASNFVNQVPIKMFELFYDSLDRRMSEGIAHIEQTPGALDNAQYADAYSAWKAAFQNEKYVPDEEVFHIGLDEVKPGCLDPYSIAKVFNPDEHGGRNTQVETTRAMRAWIPAVKDVVGKGRNKVVAWHDALTHYPPSIAKDLMPQIWDSTMTEDQTEFVWSDIFRNETDAGCIEKDRCIGATDLIWSPSSDMYLDCGLGNNAVSGFGSYCRPWKTFWHLFKTDPRKFNELKLKTPNANPLGGEVALWGEQGTHDNMVERYFPRAAAMAAPLWHGTADAEITYSSNWTDVLSTFDFTDLWTQDFDDEYEWNRWALSMGNTGMDFMPEKTIYCGMDVYMGDVNCRKFGKTVYDFEVGRGTFGAAVAPTTESTEAGVEDQTGTVIALGVCLGIALAAVLGTCVWHRREVKSLKSKFSEKADGSMLSNGGVV